MNTETRLGIKVFYYYLSKKLTWGLGLVVVAIIISSIKTNSVNTDFANFIFKFLVFAAIVVIIFEILWSWILYIKHTFILHENALTIRTGILSKKEVSIPYRQIQDVTVEQSFSRRMLGVCKLVILTAAHDNNDSEGEAEGVFEIIDLKVAQDLRSAILERSSVVPKM